MRLIIVLFFIASIASAQYKATETKGGYKVEINNSVYFVESLPVVSHSIKDRDGKYKLTIKISDRNGVNVYEETANKLVIAEVREKMMVNFLLKDYFRIKDSKEIGWERLVDTAR